MAATALGSELGSCRPSGTQCHLGAPHFLLCGVIKATQHVSPRKQAGDTVIQISLRELVCLELFLGR